MLRLTRQQKGRARDQHSIIGDLLVNTVSGTASYGDQHPQTLALLARYSLTKALQNGPSFTEHKLALNTLIFVRLTVKKN